MTSSPTGPGAGAGGEDRELLAVLVALEPLDSRKWDYLDLQRRTFHADAMLHQPWSSGERALIEAAQSLWDEGRVDLGYIACALDGRHLQAVLDATAVRAGQDLHSNTSRAVARLTPRTTIDTPDRTGTSIRGHEPAQYRDLREPGRGLELWPDCLSTSSGGAAGRPAASAQRSSAASGTGAGVAGPFTSKGR